MPPESGCETAVEYESRYGLSILNQLNYQYRADITDVTLVLTSRSCVNKRYAPAELLS